MSRQMRFWRNVIVIGLAHVAALVGLVRWGGMLKKPPKMDVMWMATTAGMPSAALVQTAESPETEPASAPEPTSAPLAEETPAASEIPLPTATPIPAATPKPKPSAAPKASPTPKAKEEKSSKSTPKPTPEKERKKKTSPTPDAAPAKKSSPVEKKNATVAVAPVKGGAAGSSAAGSGAANAAQSNLYGNMLHDRFFGAWAQPTTATAKGSRMSARVQLRIEKDGRVSDFRIVQSSGNVVVDESIAAVGQRVTKVDPLPTGLAADGHYDVSIKFELDVE